MITYKRFVFLSIVFCLIELQCKNSDNSTLQENGFKPAYIDQFKLTYFRKLLIKSYNNSKAVQEIINLDHSGFTEPILTMDDERLIDSLTTADNKEIKTDSTSSIGRVAEGAEGKHPLGFILDKLASGSLDSLANKRYKLQRVWQMMYED